MDVRQIQNTHLFTVRPFFVSKQQNDSNYYLFIGLTISTHTIYKTRSLSRYPFHSKTNEKTYLRWIECIIKLFTMRNKYTRLETIPVMQYSASHAHMIATAISNGFGRCVPTASCQTHFRGKSIEKPSPEIHFIFIRKLFLLTDEKMLSSGCLSLQTWWKTVINIRICCAFRYV